MEHHVAGLIGLIHRHRHDGGGDRGGLGSLLTHLYLSLLQHGRHIHGGVGHVAEMGLARLENRRGAKGRDGLVERGLGGGGEAGQLQIDQTLGHAGLQLGKLLAVELPRHLGGRLTLSGQDNGHRVGTIAVGKGHGSVILIVGIHELMLLPHHVDLLDVAGVTAERLRLGLVLVELGSPSAVEVDGVHQHGGGGGVELVHDLGNHTVGLLGTPSVDLAQGLGRREIHALHLCLEEGLHGGGILVLESHLLVHGDAVGYVDLGTAVERRRMAGNRLVGVVERLQRCAVLPQRLHDLGLRGALGPIGQHAHEVGHADGREHLGVRALLGAEKVEGKVVGLGHSLLLSVAQDEVLLIEVAFDLGRVHTVIRLLLVLLRGARAKRGSGQGCHNGCMAHVYNAFFHIMTNFVFVYDTCFSACSFA